MKTVSELNSKIWFRLLKVVFIILFLLVQCFGILITYWTHDEKIITPETFVKVGKLVKNKYPESYNDLSDEDVGRRLYEHNFTGWSGYTTDDYAVAKRYEDRIYIERINKYSLIKRVSFCILTFIIITFLFWLISRAFYYIVLGSLRPPK